LILYFCYTVGFCELRLWLNFSNYHLHSGFCLLKIQWLHMQRWAGEARVVRVMPNLPCLVGATAAGAFVSISFLTSRCTHFLSIPICAAVRFWVLSDFFALPSYD
jgi:hypothetical protein